MGDLCTSVGNNLWIAELTRSHGGGSNLVDAVLNTGVCSPRPALIPSNATIAREVSQMIADPEWFPIDLDRERSEIIFVRAGYDTLSKQSFLTSDVWDASGLEYRRVALGRVLAHFGNTIPRPHLNMIWHTGFCGSTLIAQTLDSRERNLSLREPTIMMKLADLKRAGVLERDGQTAQILPAILYLLSRPHAKDAAITIKAPNSTNVLARDVSNVTTGKALFLFSDCTSFLEALLRRGQRGAHYGRRVYILTRGDGIANPLAEWSQDHLFDMTDLDVGAIAWHMQIAEFIRSMPEIGAQRSSAFDFDSFLEEPASSLHQLDAYFGLGQGETHVAQVVHGPMLRRHSKSGREFGAHHRQTEREAIDPEMRKELERIVAWSYDQCSGTPREAPLPNLLIPISKTYCPTPKLD